MSGKQGFFSERNHIGQKKKPFRLSREQRQLLCEGVERAINRRENEARVYWPSDLRRITVVGITLGDRTKIQ